MSLIIMLHVSSPFIFAVLLFDCFTPSLFLNSPSIPLLFFSQELMTLLFFLRNWKHIEDNFFQRCHPTSVIPYAWRSLLMWWYVGIFLLLVQDHLFTCLSRSCFLIPTQRWYSSKRTFPFSLASSVLLFSTESALLVCRHGYFSHLKQTHTETYWLPIFLQHLPYILCILLQSYLYISVQFSRSVVSDSLQPHESQHTRPPCPSPTPGVHSDSCPSSRWCHPAISSSVVPFFFCPQSLPPSESFPLFSWGGQRIGVSA